MYKSEQWQKYDYTKIYVNLLGEKFACEEVDYLYQKL